MWNRLKITNMPIHFLLLLSFGIVFTFMILLSYLSYTNYKSDKLRNTRTVVEQANRQSLEKIDLYIQDLKNASKFPYYENTDNYNFLNILTEFNKSGSKNLLLQKATENVFYKILNHKPQIHSVYIFNLFGDSEYKMRRGLMFIDYRPENEQWFKKSIEIYGLPLITDNIKLENISDDVENTQTVFTISRGIVDINNSEVIGVIMINTKMDYLSEICRNMLLTPGHRIMIRGSDGHVIYDTNPQQTDSDLRYFTSQHSSEESGWEIISIIPLRELTEDMNRTRNITTIVTSIIIFIALLFVLFFYRQISKPLKKLNKLMKSVEKGNFDVNIEIDSQNEIGQAASTFNTMTRKIKKLINEVYIDKINQQELELQMLQQQINPHFLYNSLESIHMMAEINRDMETSRMARSLGRFLRYSISEEYSIVTVKDEMEYLNDYILLQKERFDELFDIAIEIDNNLNHMIIIKLILQPLVENAIYHGLANRDSGGLITIRAYKNEFLIFEVIDNGDGMSEEKVSNLTDYINFRNESFKSIGLRNVHKRIRLKYGADYGLTIISKPDMGTTMRVVLPLIEK